MAAVLESVMLICFGFSWPLSLMKNIKARSAKGMSLPFIILILSGYIAGIIAKFVGGHPNRYVLAVYFLNFFFVSLNLVTYFRNLRLDRAAETESNT